MTTPSPPVVMSQDQSGFSLASKTLTHTQQTLGSNIGRMLGQNGGTKQPFRVQPQIAQAQPSDNNNNNGNQPYGNAPITTKYTFFGYRGDDIINPSTKNKQFIGPQPARELSQTGGTPRPGGATQQAEFYGPIQSYADFAWIGQNDRLQSY